MPIPDVNFHPEATGLAAKIVEQHKDQQDLVFYAGWFCPFVQRTWIALEEKKVPYQYVEINPYKKEGHFLAINPKGLVPAVEYRGTALYESLVLNEFLEDAFPSAKPLLPKDPVLKAKARIWIDHLTKTHNPASFRLLQSQETEKQDEARKELVSSLEQFTEQIKGPYFFGEEFTLVDAAIAPWILRDWILQEHRGFKRSDAGDKWLKYTAAIENRDSVKNTLSDNKHLKQLYDRYLKDEAQSEAAKAIRAGRPIP